MIELSTANIANSRVAGPQDVFGIFFKEFKE